MLIVYDIKVKELNTKNLLIEAGAPAGIKRNTKIVVFQQYMSIFGPFATFGRQQVAAIDVETGNEIPGNSWTAQLKTEAEQLKSETPFAWGLFRNSFIVAAVFLGLYIATPYIKASRTPESMADQIKKRDELLKAQGVELPDTGPAEEHKSESAKAETRSPEELKEILSKVGSGDVIRVMLHRTVHHTTSPGFTLVKIVRIDGNKLIVKRHKETIAKDISADYAALNHNDDGFSDQEEKYDHEAFLSRSVLFSPRTADSPLPKTVATALDLEKTL